MSFINENGAFKKAFISTFRDQKNSPISNSKYSPTGLDFYNTIRSLTELIFLKKLDYHLNSFFVQNEIDNSKIQTVTREELSPSVLKNKVIDLITKDFIEREAFLTQGYPLNDASMGTVVYTTGKNGVIYDRLELEMPPNSEIRRNNENFLEIESKLFKITFKHDFDGTSTVIERELIQGEYDSPFLVKLNIIVDIKKSFVFKNDSLEIYKWLDSFIDEFHEYSSIDSLEKRSNLPLLKILKSLNNTEN